MIVDTVALERGLNAAFKKAQDELSASSYRKQLRDLLMEVPSAGSSEKYGWFGDFPQVREWIGDKKAHELKDYDFEISNKDFEVTIAIDRNEIADDRAGIVLPRLQSMAQALQDHKLDLVASLIDNGGTGLAYDGVAFFSDVSGDRVNDNLLAGTGTTVDQIKADIYSAYSAMLQFKSDTGKILGLEMDTIACPAALIGLILEAVNAAPGATTFNVLSTWIKNVIVIPSLTDADDWYGFCSNRALKPFIYQRRQEPTPVLDDTQVKRNRKLYYSAEMRGDAGYGLPQLALKVVNSA